MGGSQSRRDESFRSSQWQQAHDIQIPPQSNRQYTVVRNRITGQLLDKYSLQFPNQKEYNNYLQSISYRRNQPNIVRVIHYQPAVVKQFCGSSYMLNVYLQHCKSRLSQYEDIPFPDYLYCAMAMLDGYKKLYSKIGRFQVTERQVMIDNNGQVRVWLNEDFSQNQAQDMQNQHYVSNDPNEQQYGMVQDIMRIIFDNSDLSEGPKIKLVDFYERQKNNFNHKVGFQEAKNIIHEYARINQIQITDIFKSIFQLYVAQADQKQYQDTMSFKNQLFNQEQYQQHNSSKIGHHQQYEPVQSIINAPPPNLLARPNAVYHPQINQNNFSPRIASSNFINQSASHRSGPLNTPNYGFSSQPSFASPPYPLQSPPKQQPLPNILSIFGSNQNNNQFQNLGPQYQKLPIQPTPTNIKPPQGFPLMISSNQQPSAPNNILINRNPIPFSVPPFQNYSIPRQNRPIQPIFNNFNRPAQIIQIPNQPIQPIQTIQPIQHFQPISQNQPIFQQLVNQSPKSGFKIQVPPIRQEKYKNANQINNVNINENNNFNHEDHEEEQQVQIQKNILKQQNNFHQDVNEANIIRDLSELHKIQQQQKSKRSGNPDTSRNYKSNNSQYERSKTNQHILQTDEHREVDSPRKYQNHNDEYQEQNEHNNHEEQSQGGNKFNFQAGYVTEQIGQYGTGNYYQASNLSANQNQANTNANANNNNFTSKTIEAPYFQNSSKPPVRHQISQPQYSGVSQNSNDQINNYNSLVLNQINGRQFNQANIISNQINQMNTNKAFLSQDSSSKVETYRNNFIGGVSKKQSYYTLSNQIQLDPEIAADLAAYVKS